MSIGEYLLVVLVIIFFSLWIIERSEKKHHKHWSDYWYMDMKTWQDAYFEIKYKKQKRINSKNKKPCQ